MGNLGIVLGYIRICVVSFDSLTVLESKAMPEKRKRFLWNIYGKPFGYDLELTNRENPQYSKVLIMSWQSNFAVFGFQKQKTTDFRNGNVGVWIDNLIIEGRLCLQFPVLMLGYSQLPVVPALIGCKAFRPYLHHVQSYAHS